MSEAALIASCVAGGGLALVLFVPPWRCLFGFHKRDLSTAYIHAESEDGPRSWAHRCERCDRFLPFTPARERDR